MASAAALKRPLAARNDVLAVIPGPLPDWTMMELQARIDKVSDAVVIMKVGRHFARIGALIERLGLTDAAGYCERVSLAEAEDHAAGIDVAADNRTRIFRQS